MSKKTFEQLLGQKLRLRREQLDKTQADMEHDAAISDNHYGKIERGKAEPSVYTFFKLWKVLDLNADQLFKEIDREMNKKKEDE